MSRLPYLTPAELTDRQQEGYAAITSGPRGNPQRPGGGLARGDGALVGPFNAMLHAPEVGDLVQQLGAALRYQNSVPPTRSSRRNRGHCPPRTSTVSFDWNSNYRM